MPRPWVLPVAFGLIAVSAAAQDAGSRVSVPLSEYEALKNAQSRASVTVVDSLRLGGSFKGRDLDISFVGRAAGTLPPIDVLTSAAGIVVFGCDGDGIVSRGDAGAFRLTPLAPRFTVRCKLAARGSDRLEMWSTSSVLWVESNVADGEFVLGSEGQDGRRQFSVVRRVTAAAEGQTLAPSATGRYRITLRPDETRFLYQIEVHNPNRARQMFEVAMVSGEQVQQVDAPVPYDVPSGRHRFDLPPGDTVLKISGSLAGSSFQPPIQASVQYCVLESHPLLRPVVVGEPKRVSPQEVAIATQYRGAQAFIVGPGERIVWKATKLEALRTTSFAVRQVIHNFFLPADGPVLGESTLSIDNQGASDVSLPMTSQPTFASLQGEPVLLTKNDQGHLWLPIAQGQQELVVQHRQPYHRVAGFGFATLTLPQVPVPATKGNVILRYPADWYPLYESFLSETRVWTPDAGEILGGLFFFVWTERVLLALGLRLRRRLLLAAALTLAVMSWGWALAVVLVADIVVTAVVVWPAIRRRGLGIGIGVAVALIAVFLFMIAIAIPSLLRARVASTPYPASAAYDRAMSAPEAEKKAELTRNAAEQSYQGLPARFDMPNGVRVTGFERELLETDTPRAAHVVMISQTLLGWLQGLVVLIALALVWRARGELGHGWKARREAARVPPTAEGD
jgi:hypothetical protein